MKLRNANEIKQALEGLTTVMSRCPVGDTEKKQRMSDMVRTLCWVVQDGFGDITDNGVNEILNDSKELGRQLQQARILGR